MSLARTDDQHGYAAHGLLRAACADAHARLDAKAGRFDLSDRDSYAEMLMRLSGPLTALESALANGAWPRLFADWRMRARAQALRADLMQLGGHFVEERAAPIEDDAAAFGALYVLEGSRLGGRVQARMVQASADPVVRGATNFFHHGAGQPFWRDFIVALNASPAVAAQPERARAAALDAFARFEAAFG
ncbi:MAG: biliverdin-producing heme oxygenase [Hyphomonadaceae bacterium]